MKKALLFMATSTIMLLADNAINNYGTMNVGGNVNQIENNQQYTIDKMSIENNIQKFSIEHMKKMTEDTNYASSIEANSNTAAIKVAKEINKENLSKPLKKQQCTKASFGLGMLKVNFNLAVERCESFFE